MASLLPPPYGVAFSFDVVLFAQSGNQIKTTPTLAAGDFVIAKATGTGDMGATANLTTTPSEVPASSGIVKVSLSATEMQADRVFVRWVDASGAEWHSGGVEILTATQTFDTMDTNIDSILTDTGTDGVVLANDAIAAAKIATGAITSAKFAAGAIDAAAIATNAIDADALAADVTTELQSGLATAANLATLTGYVDTEVASILAAVDTEVAAIKAKTDNLPTDPADQSAVEAAITAATSPLATSASISALNNLSSAQAQTAATAALNAYDPPTKAELDSAVAPLATTVAVADLPTNAELAAALASADDAVLVAIAALENTSAADFLTALQAMLVDGAITWMELQRVLLALIAGETTGGGTTDLAFLAQDGLTERIAATVDGSGNRTSVTLDGSA